VTAVVHIDRDQFNQQSLFVRPVETLKEGFDLRTLTRHIAGFKIISDRVDQSIPINRIRVVWLCFAGHSEYRFA